MTVNILKNSVLLRNLSSKDLNAVYKWASDFKVAKYTSWDAYTCINELNDYLVNIVERHKFCKAICYEGEIIGSVTIEQGKGPHSCRAELGYVLNRSFWGRGITPAAVALAIAQAFKDLDIYRIEAFVDPENKRSCRVLEKVGMSCEGHLKKHVIFKGELRDSYIYAVTR